MKIHLTRHLGYHVVQTYIPSMVFVTLSWLALFVSAENIPGNRNLALKICLTSTLIYVGNINPTCNISPSLQFFTLLNFRACWNGDDNPSYIDCYVWCNSKGCSKSILCFLPWRMDVIMHYFCVWKYARICHCTPILYEKPKKESGVTRIKYANYVVSNLCWLQHNLLDNSSTKLASYTYWRLSVYNPDRIRWMCRKSFCKSILS